MPENFTLKVRCGKNTYIKQDGTIGTAGKGALVGEEVAFTLAATQDQTLISEVNGQAADEMAVTIHDGSRWVVRRLTPVECERLQGMPDGHTDLTGCDVDVVTDRVAGSLGYGDSERSALRRKVNKWSGGCPDTPRYKCVGNSFAVPVIRWLGERIQEVQDEMDAMGGDEPPFS